MSNIEIKTNVMLESAAAWDLANCEPTYGWPGQWTLIWRSEKYHGKISGSLKSKTKPTASRIRKVLLSELTERFSSTLRCDAKRVAYRWLHDNAKTLPYDSETLKLLNDALYDLDNRIGNQFWNSKTPVLFTPSTHGWILAEICEIRCLVSSLGAELARRLA